MAKRVIKFHAAWCGPCKQYAPTFEKVKQELQSDEIEFQEVDADNDPEALAAEFKVRGIPCTVVLENGIEISRRAGSMSEEELRSIILN